MSLDLSRLEFKAVLQTFDEPCPGVQTFQVSIRNPFRGVIC